MEEEVLEVPIKQLYVGHEMVLDILLLNSTPWDATIVVDLVIKPKLVLVQEYNQSRAHHIHQQREPMNLGR